MATLYQTEDICMQAKESYMQAFEAKSQEYKDKAKTDAFCVPFDSFPIKGLPPQTGA